MRPEDFEFLYSLEERYWWFVAMRRITDAIVAPQVQHKPLRIFDAGCGTGYNLQYYEKAGHVVWGLDIAPEAVDGVRRRGFTKITQASAAEIPYQSATFDLVFSFDVLCQMPMELSDNAIREMSRVLKPGGFLFVRVPAFEWMRSSHDADLHTVHRFTRGELQGKLERAGLRTKLSTYANSYLFPVVIVRRFLKRLGIGTGTDVKPLPSGLGWIDPIFQRVLASESGILGHHNRLPFGLSVICYAEKPM